MGKRFERFFFERYTPEVARGLLGCRLVRETGEGVLSGRIVEVEAYRGEDDPASHAYKGLTRRTAVMFGEGGHAYVYLSYGANRCLNVTTERKGTPGAVLIRAVEPLDGIELMKRNRKVADLTELTSGPGKLTKAMNIELSLNGEDLVSSERLYLLKGPNREIEIESSTRIGISVGLNHVWRFFARGNAFVSKGKPVQNRL